MFSCVNDYGHILKLDIIEFCLQGLCNFRSLHVCTSTAAQGSRQPALHTVLIRIHLLLGNSIGSFAQAMVSVKSLDQGF